MTEKKTKPKIEEMAADLLDGDKLKNFLDFNQFLKDNKLPKGSTSPIAWSIRYKNKMIGHLRIWKGAWLISYFKSEELFERCEKYISGELKEFVLSNINTTPGCGKCKGAENKVILGKMFDRVCRCHMIKLDNPEGKSLEYAKELALINKNIVDDILADNV